MANAPEAAEAAVSARTGDRAAAARPPRTPVSPLRQLLRLARVEMLLFYRYRTAAYTAATPLMFLLPALALSGDGPHGIDQRAFAMAPVLMLAPMTLGIMHMPTVYAARRESMLLKRYRAAGVPASALFGATTLSVVAAVAVLTGVIGAAVAAAGGALPVHPVLLLLGILLCTVVFCLLGLSVTRLARNAESAQLVSVLPFLLLLAASGSFVPLTGLPQLHTALSFLPMLPAVDLARAAYFGVDTFAAAPGAAAPLAGPEVWAAAAPALAVLTVWIGIAAWILRYFRWDPRQGG
ncbi:ABC transporter permease [Nocardiopsis coralliicola]